MQRRLALLAGALVSLVLFLSVTFRQHAFDVAHLSSALAYGYDSALRAATTKHDAASTTTLANKPATGWTFNAARDRNDHSLTAEQCDAAFPDLYHEIDRAQAFWRQRQGREKLTEDQWGIDWTSGAGLRVLIHDGQLYVTESKGLNHFLHWEERSKSTLANLHRALLSAREPVPNIEFGIKIDDNIHLEEGSANTTTWCFSRDTTDPAMDQVWLIPDFNFWAYPRVAGAYGDYQREAIEEYDDWDAKIDRLVWRGTQAFNPGIRQALLDVAQGQPWSDVHVVKEDSDDEDSLRYHIQMPEHCGYKYAVHTEGTTWSGRLKYLLSCHTTVIVHKLAFTTHLYHLLKADGPDQNVVQTERDWRDLPEAMNALVANPAHARRIADNARDMFRDRYMTPAAQACYFRRLFHVWAEMTPTPDPYVLVEQRHGPPVKKFRGMTYEHYLFFKEDYRVDYRVQ